MPRVLRSGTIRSVMRRGWIIGLASLALASLAVGCSGSDGGAFSAGLDMQFDAAPSRVDFLPTSLGTTAERKVQVRHVGDEGTLTLTGVVLDTPSGDLVLEGPNEVSIGPGEAAEWTIQFTPTGFSPIAATLRMDHNINGRPPIAIPVTTPSQLGQLSIEPSTVDFGPVVSGTSQVEAVWMRNIGVETLEVQGFFLKSGSSNDFEMLLTGESAGPLAPGSSRKLELSYTPTGHGADAGWLQVLATGLSPEVVVSLNGNQVGPGIQVAPWSVLFGAVPVGDVQIRSLSVSNIGNLDLVIDAIVPSEEAAEGLSVLWGTEEDGPWVLAPGEKEWIDVVFAPQTAEQVVSGDLGFIEFYSNDLLAQPLSVPVSGQPGAPVLEVSPGDVVDFGYIAQGVTGKRVVKLINHGELPLTVDSLEVLEPASSEMGVAWDPAFSPTFDVPSPEVLEPGEVREVTLTFLNDGAAQGTLYGALKIVSNDSEHPEWLLDLVGHRAGEPTCQPLFNPIYTAFGGVPHQTSKSTDAILVNKGSGECTFHDAWIDHCTKDGVLDVCLEEQASPHFKFDGLLPVGQVIGPGDYVTLPLRFEAPTFVGGPESGVDTYQARLTASVADPYQAQFVETPSSQPGWTPGPNLFGDSGIPHLNIYPDTIDFGYVALGCQSPTIMVSLLSSGPVPVTVTQILETNCTDEFDLSELPETPLEIPVGQGVGFSPAFTPASTGERLCEVKVMSTDPDLPAQMVEVRAEGVQDVLVVDYFEGKSVQEVDVLFVVDDSGSMMEEQTNLSANFESFINVALAWNADYRIGVTTTDMDNIKGSLQGIPPVVTPDDDVQTFIGNVLVGTTGSGTEQGMLAAQEAVYGSFKPYIRQDAQLVVIFVSDEEDQSPGMEINYLDAFVDAKNGQLDKFLAFSIVGDPGGCNSAAGNADAGMRYIKVSELSGGAWASICNESFAEALTEFGEGTFGPKTSFPLGGFPKSNTVTVLVNGVPCEEGWYLGGEGKTVIFEESSECLPMDGDDVSIQYELDCIEPAAPQEP
ncbi:MAG: hypothetical protein CL940_02560 [Deltaproteobacteria bacterium]|mgnify:CR=1 FL=1|nr:hypothetical protein [Deltaproteobacteria bacterium]